MLFLKKSSRYFALATYTETKLMQLSVQFNHCYPWVYWKYEVVLITICPKWNVKMFIILLFSFKLKYAMFEEKKGALPLIKTTSYELFQHFTTNFQTSLSFSIVFPNSPSYWQQSLQTYDRWALVRNTNELGRNLSSWKKPPPTHTHMSSSPL